MDFFLSPPHHIGLRYKSKARAARRCCFEPLEPRQMLAADFSVGAVDTSYGQTGGPTGSISGNVYATLATSGCETHQAGANLAGVRVQLLDVAGTVLEERVTDAQGAYHFLDLLPGQYAVRQQTPQGFFEGASRVGEGGGITFGSNQVGEIDVLAGQTLAGYDFCDSTHAPEPTGPIDRPIVPHDKNVKAEQNFSFLSLSLQAAPAAQQDAAVEPVIFQATAAQQTSQLPLIVSSPQDIFGGSSQPLNVSESIKAWDDDPFDSWFSTASYSELAEANQAGLEALESILSQTESSSDALFGLEGTADSAVWWQGKDRLQLDQLLGEVEIFQQNADDASPRAVPQVARRREEPQREKKSLPTQETLDEVGPTRGRTAQQDRAAAIDQVLTYDLPSDAQPDQEGETTTQEVEPALTNTSPQQTS